DLVEADKMNPDSNLEVKISQLSQLIRSSALAYQSKEDELNQTISKMKHMLKRKKDAENATNLTTDSTTEVSSSPETNQGSPSNDHRRRLNRRLLADSIGETPPSPKPKPLRPPQPRLPSNTDDYPTYKELFVPPKTSLVACMMTKPKLSLEISQIDYDSSESDIEDEVEEEPEESDDEFDDDPKKKTPKKKVNTEFSDTNSISWSIVRVAVLKLARIHVEKFLRCAGKELQDLPSVSPPLHAMCRTLSKWEDWFYDRYVSLGCPPPSYMESCATESTFYLQGSGITRYKSILDPINTPFEQRSETKAIRRLWNYLVHQEAVQEMFIRLVYGSRRRAAGLSFCDSASVISDSDVSEVEAVNKSSRNILAVRILHKDQESVNAFALNQNKLGEIALACGNEIQEMNIEAILDSTKPYDNECNLDLTALDRDTESYTSMNYLLTQTPHDNLLSNSTESGMSTNQGETPVSTYTPSNSHVSLGKRETKRQRIENVKRLCPHPTADTYMTGCSDGSVHLFQWGYPGIVATLRPPGAFAKVNRIRFHSLGTKIGVADGDGNISLWQYGTRAPFKPYFTHQCHNKFVNDFQFVGSSSVFVSAGLSSDGKNVALWDSLLPQKKAQIHAFVSHDTGSTCVLYSPKNQTIVSAGKKGDLSVWDIRQRTLRQRLTGHENGAAVRAMAMDPGEEYYATGSSEGDIKLWNMETSELLLALPGEHSRTGFFRPMNSSSNGVNSLTIDSEGRLFSCGSDGSFKFRCLPYKDWTGGH
ncbi:hypothetical protein QYM36_017080, partial [Artemia franciscana]